MNRIAVVIPYFGSWPIYMNLYLKGCQSNEWLDIFFITNCTPPTIEIPTNVRFINSSLNQISLLIKAKLDMDINLNDPYKLCDFKPCYGLMFSDILKEYDYWGYSDIDLIYGNLKKFVINRINKGFDVLSSREEILSGSFTLLRNTPVINNLFRKSSKFTALLSSDKHQALDETAGSVITWQGGSKLDLPQHCFTYIVAKENSEGNLKCSFETICKEHISKDEFIVYDKGTIKSGNSEYGYYHYVCNKNDEQYWFPNWRYIPEQFLVNTTGFHRYHDGKISILTVLKREVIGFMLKYQRKIKNKIKQLGIGIGIL